VRHKRSLQQDLKHLQERYGITGLVCLLNAAELRVSVFGGMACLAWCLVHKLVPAADSNIKHESVFSRALDCGSMQQVLKKLAWSC